MNIDTNEEETFDEWFAKMEALVKPVEEPVEKPLTSIEQLSKTVAELIRRVEDLEGKPTNIEIYRQMFGAKPDA